MRSDQRFDEEAFIGNIRDYVSRLSIAKGRAPFDVDADCRLLSGEAGLDSLDLAVLVRELEAIAGVDPFRKGFRNFQTVRELARLYADAVRG